MKIALGSDHHGVLARKKLCEMIRGMGHEVFDFGPSSPEDAPVDYPDIAAIVAEKVSSKEVERGILLCGTGIGMCIVANKFRGVRAAPVIDELTAEISRRHNDLNVLCLSGDVLTEAMIDRLVGLWIDTPFDGGRHERRIEKIHVLENERRYTEGG
ncbi:MAG TPA: ribose 5-phosphate isomerase B [Planctomycetaceae bacterium]|nr:ribose 5-phosphate isomerase B [Planctomycetaceae bacterium]